jgi:hypothetical protein
MSYACVEISEIVDGQKLLKVATDHVGAPQHRIGKPPNGRISSKFALMSEPYLVVTGRAVFVFVKTSRRKTFPETRNRVSKERRSRRGFVR